jgi:uncharacterized coiled-coil protein SlyX
MMETQYERRIAILERELAEQCATIQGLRLALDEAQRQIAELTELHICEQGSAEVTAETVPNRHNERRSDSRKGGNRG